MKKLNKQKLSEREISDRIKAVHGDTVVIDLSTYKNARTSARFIDKDYGEWWTQPGAVFRGARHKKRYQSKQKLSLDVYVKRLKNVHGDQVKLDATTYEKFTSKARFIDCEFGDWWAKADNVLNGSKHPARGAQNRKNTWMKKYGVDNPFKSELIQRKALSKIRKNVSKIQHWKSNETLTCVGSYEVAFVKWCNENHYDFDWQITFKMPNKKSYRIDAYVKNGPLENMWIEIKGYFRDNESKEKWNWFHSTHENSKLLMKDELKELNIL